MISKIVRDKFHMQYTNEGAQVQLCNEKDCKSILRKWQQQNVHFHAYTGKLEKRRTFVIRGLHEETDTNDIKTELEEQDFEILNINKMKGTKFPLFMVTIKGDIKINKLNTQHQYITNTKITWDRYISKRVITQCHRCQK